MANSTQVSISALKPVVPVVPAPLTRTSSTVKDNQPNQGAYQTQKTALSSSHVPSSQEPIKEATFTLQPSAGDSTADASQVVACAEGRKASASKHDAVPAVATKRAGKDSDKRHPGKIDVAVAKEGAKTDTVKAKGSSKSQRSTEASTTNQPVASIFTGEAQPSLPTKTMPQQISTSGGRLSHTRTTKAPPTARLDTAAKAVPSPTTVETSSVNKASSRRQSLASIHPPGTPISEKISDNASLTSTSVSRANSPPPSKVGTAPVRHVTKSQQKKERQARAKQAEDVAKVEATPATLVAEEPEIAPIIGRKKKAKKNQSTSDSTPTATRPTSPVQTDRVIEEKQESQPTTPLKASKDEMKKENHKAEPPKEPESPATPDVPSSNNEQSRPSLTAAAILASLQKSGDLTATVQELFKGVPGLNQRYDVPPNEYPRSPGTPPLTEAQRALLDQGIPVCIEMAHNRRVVVLPDRTTLSHMSKEQAQRYVALHRSISLTSEQGFFNSLRQGSVRLQLHPPRHVSIPSDDGQALVNRFGSPPVLEQVPAGRTSLPVAYPTDDRLGPQRPIMEVDDAERALMASRKETEALEKKLNALMRKNRRMMFGGH